jgi:hypothetical protein
MANPATASSFPVSAALNLRVSPQLGRLRIALAVHFLSLCTHDSARPAAVNAAAQTHQNDR